MPLIVYVLGAAIFALTTSEYMVAGLMPALAAEFGVSFAAIGYLVTFYAGAMAVGGPLLTTALLRVPRKNALLGLIALFVVGQVIGALAPGYAVMVAARLVTAVAAAAFFGVALTACAELVEGNQFGRASSLVLAELGDAAGFDALAEETLASGGNPEAIDELRGRYPALLQMPATETPAATTKDDDWSDLPLAEPPVLQQPDATSGADGFGDLNLDLDLDWGALENPLDNPDLPRRAAAGKAEPAEEEPLAFESNLHELPDVAEYEHLELDQPEPATVPPEEASASLDRARACIDSGDLDQASRILRLVVAHGDPWQKAEARELLALIA